MLGIIRRYPCSSLDRYILKYINKNNPHVLHISYWIEDIFQVDMWDDCRAYLIAKRMDGKVLHEYNSMLIFAAEHLFKEERNTTMVDKSVITVKI